MIEYSVQSGKSVAGIEMGILKLKEHSSNVDSCLFMLLCINTAEQHLYHSCIIIETIYQKGLQDLDSIYSHS